MDTPLAAAADEGGVSPWPQPHEADAQACLTCAGGGFLHHDTVALPPPSKCRRVERTLKPAVNEAAAPISTAAAPAAPTAQPYSPGAARFESFDRSGREADGGEAAKGGEGKAGTTVVVYACVDSLPHVVVIVDAAGNELIELD